MFNQVLEYLRGNRESLPKDLSEQDKSVFQDELRYWGLQQNCSTEQTFHAEDSSDKFVFRN